MDTLHQHVNITGIPFALIYYRQANHTTGEPEEESKKILLPYLFTRLAQRMHQARFISQLS